MLRKTLTILSLIGLLLSVAAWGASYFSISYERTLDGVWTRLDLTGANVYYMQADFADSDSTAGRWSIEGFSFKSGGPVPWMTFGPLTFWSVHMPLWIPTILFGSFLSYWYALPLHHRYKRKKLGLCVKCGYNLKGLIEPRCPECGTAFGEVMMFSRRRVFIPRFSGQLEFPALPDDLLATLESRIQAGFLVRGNCARSNYRICSSSNDSVTISADDWWTAINVGLNEVRLRREGDRRITFEVSFWRWTGYAAMLGMLIFAPLLGIFVFTDWMKPWLPPNRLETLGALSIGIFFCLCWPWILTEFHKKPAARCLERILHETFTDAA